jgi:hypothetical protein
MSLSGGIALAWGPALAGEAERAALQTVSGLPCRTWIGEDQIETTHGTLGLVSAELPPQATTGFVSGSGRVCWTGARIGASTAPAPDAKFLLLTILDIPASHEEEFNAWYDTEHVVRLCAVDGVIAAARFRSIEGVPRYLTCYYLSDSAVLSSTEWETAARTPWTARIGPRTTGRLRMLFARA